jgi:hypothetical protein
MVSTTAAMTTRTVTAAPADQPAVSKLDPNVPEVPKVAADTRARPRPTLLSAALTSTSQ